MDVAGSGLAAHLNRQNVSPDEYEALMECESTTSHADEHFCLSDVSSTIATEANA